jgi:hypothetical protein
MKTADAATTAMMMIVDGPCRADVAADAVCTVAGFAGFASRR